MSADTQSHDQSSRADADASASSTGGSTGPVETVSAPQPTDGSVSDSATVESDPAAADNRVAGEQPSTESANELKWYAVHTYSGHENKARTSLLERVKNQSMEDKFGEVLIPTESVVEVVKGKRRTTTRKFYPGYMFVQMLLDVHTFYLVKSTPKITGFLGGNKPTPVRDDEIAGINRPDDRRCGQGASDDYV